ncbi:MAG: hypothetical protein Q8K51_09780 [Nitrospirota bacterium]|nr:hypothetical protein [Nitrospirota bacterium]
MKTGEMAKRGLYIGAGVGLVLFALIGLLPGSFIGGVLGLKIASAIYGTPVGIALLPRLIVGASMLFGMVISGIVFVIGASLIGWLAGYVVDAVKYSRVSELETAVKTK